MSAGRKIQKLPDFWLVAGFVAMLAVLALTALSRFDGHAISELFPGFGPGLSLEKLQNFTRQAEISFDGDFGGRDALVAANLAVKGKLFPADLGPYVMAGRDGWLYYSGGGMAENFLGHTPYSPEELQGWQAELERRRDWLAARGIDFLFVVAPNKESVYPEHLPGWMKKSTTRLDQLVDFIRARSTVPILDLRPAEREAARRDPVYFATDTHWNLMGAFAASEAIAAAVSNRISGYQPLSREDFEIERRRAPGLDLAQIACAPAWTEDNVFAFTPTARLPRLEFLGQGTNEIDCRKIGIGRVEVVQASTTLNRGQKGRVVVFGDSFSVGLQPFLGRHFGRVDYHWQDALDPKLIEGEKPVLIISEMVERRLGRTANPDPAGMADQGGVR